MRDPVVTKEAMPRTDVGEEKIRDRGGQGSRDGIVVSTVIRLTTSDGSTFGEISKAMEHEAFYQILKRLVKDLGWPDNEETASFSVNLAKHYRSLLPLLSQLEKDAERLRAHLREFERSM